MQIGATFNSLHCKLQQGARVDQSMCWFMGYMWSNQVHKRNTTVCRTRHTELYSTIDVSSALSVPLAYSAVIVTPDYANLAPSNHLHKLQLASTVQNAVYSCAVVGRLPDCIY